MDWNFVQCCAGPDPSWAVDLHDASDAERREQGAQFRKEPGTIAFFPTEEGHIQRCGGRGRGERRTAGDYRISARAAEIPEAWWPHSEGCSANRAPGHGQDTARSGNCRRGECAVLLDLGLRFR